MLREPHRRATDMTRLALLLALIPALALADYGSVTVDEVASFYDGDTITVTVDDWPPVIGERIKIRLRGIQAPERRSRCDTDAEKRREKALAADARIYLVERLRGAESVELRHIERGSFFRLIADVYADGQDVGREMLARGLAIPYVGGEGGKAWCGR